MKKNNGFISLVPRTQVKKNKSKAKVEMSLGIMDYLDKSTKKTSDDIYRIVWGGMKRVR